MLTEARPQSLSYAARGAALSLGLHAAVLLGIAFWAHRSPQIAHFKLPGAAHGTTFLTYYSPGSRHPVAVSATLPKKQSSDPKSERLKIVAKPEPISTEPQRADAGQGQVAESGLGEGNIRIALPQHFPHPEPDLSTLPHGAIGDVILNAVIDEHGKISELTLLKGLAPAVDEAVIATVKEWSFTPATKDGIPVVSEQELHFHYERG